MKKMKYVIIGAICICIVVGYYAYLSYRDNSPKEEELTEVQKIILKDLSGDSYPATPREVVKFYNRIVACLYNEEFTDEELHKLTDQARCLMDEELADNNPSEQYFLRVQAEVDSYHEAKRTISNVTVCDSNDVETTTMDGRECAYVTASYLIRETGKIIKSNQNYILRKDEEGKWKILAFELIEGDPTEDE